MPILATQPPAAPPEIENRRPTTSEAVPEDLLRDLDLQWQKSDYLKRQSHFMKLHSRLEYLLGLQPGWDSYDAEAPSPEAVHSASLLLWQLYAFQLDPSAVVASAEGGIGIWLSHAGRNAYIECLNSGGIIAALYSGQAEPEVVEIPGDEVNTRRELSRIRGHLAG